MSDHILYELTCGQITFGEYDDVFRLDAHCLMHGIREGIVRIITSEWLVWCDDCIKWRRWCGIHKGLAQETSRRHWRKNPGHKPEIRFSGRYLSKQAEMDLRKKVAEMEWMWYNGKVIRPGNKEQELPDEPPF